MKNKKLIVILLVLVIISACVYAFRDKNSDLNLYENNKYGFSMQIPSGWNVVDAGDVDGRYMDSYYFSNYSKNETDKYNEKYGMGYPNGYIGLYLNISDVSDDIEVFYPDLKKVEDIKIGNLVVKKEYFQNPETKEYNIQFSIKRNNIEFNFYENMFSYPKGMDIFENQILPSLKFNE